MTSQIAALAVIVLAAGTPTWASGAESIRPADVRLSSTLHGEIVVPVFIRGEGPYRFILDTGSSQTVIRQALATTLGAPAVAKALIGTSVGSLLALVVRLIDVSVGSAHVESLLATSLPSDAARMLDDGVSGILGQDFLWQFDYTLDYRASRLSWRDERHIESGVRLALEPSNGRFLVRLPQDERCRCAVRLVPDSGANQIVLFAGRQADRLRVDPALAAMMVSTLGGTGTASSVIVRALIVGPAALKDVPAARIVLPEQTTEEGDGLLPLSLFSRVSFHHHEGYMMVQP